MEEARLQAELLESKNEIRRLRERLSSTTHTVYKDLPLNSLVTKWSGPDTEVPLEEFFSRIEGSAQIGLWEESDKIRIGALKLTGAARFFIMDVPSFTRKT